MRGIVCVYAQPLRRGMSQGDLSRTASSSSFWKKPVFVPGSEALNSSIEYGFRFPELKDESEASEVDQADNVSNEALYVIGLHGSGDTISRYLQDWEVAKVALSFHIASDLLCQELYEVGRRRDWFGF